MKCLLIYKTALGLAALALLVSRIVTDDHNLAVATNHLAVVTDLLDARLDLHDVPPSPSRGGLSLVPVDDAATGQVVGAELHDHPVLGEDADVVLPHLSGDVREHHVPVAQLHPEHCVRKGLDDRSLDLDDAVLLSHVPPSVLSRSSGPTASPPGSAPW